VIVVVELIRSASMKGYRHRIALLGIVGANVLALRAASQCGPAAFRPVAEAQSALLAILSALLPSPLTGALLLVAYFGAECFAGCFGGRWPWDRATWSPSIWAASLLPICLVFRGIGLMGLPNATLSRRLNAHQFSLADAGRFTTLACVCLAAIRLELLRGTLQRIEPRTFIQLGLLGPVIAFAVLIAFTWANSWRSRLVCAAVIVVAWSLYWFLDVSAFGLSLGLAWGTKFVAFAFTTTAILTVNSLLLKCWGVKFYPWPAFSVRRTRP
jgi:hypothetical protein